MWIKTWERIDEAVIANGVLSEWEVAEMRRAYEDPTFTSGAQLTQSVWGRKLKPATDFRERSRQRGSHRG
jgi:hypothetical protein